MAITGKFIADFSSFQTAVQQAEVSLKSFEAGAGKVETSLNKMVDSFSGRKIIQDATLMAEAVERIGGTSKLTEAELQRVATTASAAAQKMTAMGIDVPPGIAKIAAEARTTTSAFGNMSGVVSQLAGAFGIAFSIGAVVQFGREVMQAGDAIQKMADQTGLSLEEVQKMQYVAGQSGTAIGSLVSALQNLQQRLGDDSSGAAGAIKKLNINLEDFKRLSPYEQMTTLAESIKSIEDPTERASAAAAIFGKNWKEILPAILSGMRELGNEAPVMSDKAVKALDDAGDALARLKTSAIVTAGTLVENFEKVFAALSGDFSNVGTGLDQFTKDLSGVEGALDKVKPPTLALGDGLKDLSLSAAEASRIEKELTETVKASIQVNNEAAAAVKRLDDAYDKMISDAKNAEGMAQMNDAADALARQAKNAEQLWLMERDAYQLSVKEKEASAAGLIQSEEEYARVAKESFAIVGGALVTHDAEVQQTTQKWHGLGAAAAAAIKLMVPPGFDYGKAYADAGFIAHGSLSGIRPRASGGPVSSGQPYMVGERGPEMFVPSSSGSILPNGSGGPTTINLVVDGRVLASVVSDHLTRSILSGRKLGSS